MDRTSSEYTEDIVERIFTQAKYVISADHIPVKVVMSYDLYFALCNEVNLGKPMFEVIGLPIATDKTLPDRFKGDFYLTVKPR